MRRDSVIRGAALGAASLLGGLIALGGVSMTGDLGGGTTTVVRASPAPTPAAPVADDGGMTVSEIYARAAPGVVQGAQTGEMFPLATGPTVIGRGAYADLRFADAELRPPEAARCALHDFH